MGDLKIHLQRTLVRPRKLKIVWEYSFRADLDHALLRTSVRAGTSGDLLALAVAPVPPLQKITETHAAIDQSVAYALHAIDREYYYQDPQWSPPSS